MKNVETLPSERTLVEWAKIEEYELTEAEAGLLLRYVLEHGCRVCLDETDKIIVVDVKNSENDIVARGIDELIECASAWNYELIQSPKVVGAYREQILMDLLVIDELLSGMGCRCGHCIGTPTVKELITVLSKLPEDYRVYNCGADNYLYLWSNKKSITIDNESWLCC